MALPQKSASLDQYYEAGVHLTAALELEDSTIGLAGVLLTMEQENLDIQNSIRLARTGQIRAYVRVVWIDRKIEDCIRDLSDAAKSADRKQPALRAHTRIFPSGGFSSLIQPSGRMVKKQIEEVRKLYPVLRELGAKEALFLDFPVKLESLCVEAEGYLKVLETADNNVEQCYIQAELFRDRWREQAYLVEAELQKLFPGQKDRVRTYFDNPTPPSKPSKKDTTDTANTPTDSSPATTTTPGTPVGSTPTSSTPTGSTPGSTPAP